VKSILGRLCSLAILLFIAATLSASTRNSQRYALVVGISSYPNYPDERKLRFADKDAEAFADFIQTPNGGSFSPNNIRVLLNKDANHEGIFQAIEWLSRTALGDDIVYIFFAGHSEIDRQGRAYFMPYDGDPQLPGALGFRADRFLEDMNDIAVGHKIVFIDACHAGAALTATGTTGASRGNITPVLTELWKTAFSGIDSTNMGFFSASSNQVSWEDNELKHGLFTHYLIRGMQGAADTNGDGKVTAEELYRYIREKVDTDSRRKPSVQTPVVTPTFEPDFPLAIVPPSPAEIVRVLDRYSNAVANGDLARIKELRDLRPDEEARMVESLRATKDKGFALKDCSVADITRDTATARCTALLTRSKDSLPAKVTFTLKRRNGEWRISY